MKKTLPILILLVAIVAAGAMIAARPEAERKPHKPNPVLVETLSVAPGTHRVMVESQGTITPLRQTSLIARVSGTVVAISDRFLQGGFFHQGDELLRLDPTDHQVALTRAEANLARARAQLAAELARAEQARRDWKAGGKGKPSPLVLRQPYVDEAQAAVKAAEADLAQAQANLERTHIRAPYDGLVLEKNVELGQFVTVGSLLGRVAATETAEIRLPLTEAELAMLPLKQDSPTESIPVILELKQGGRTVQRTGHLHRTEAVADERTRTVYAVVRLPDPYLREEGAEGNLLRFGSFVHARIPGRSFPGTYELPRHVLDVQGNLLLADPDGILHIRPAHVIAEYAGKVLIDQGIEPGEQVVITPIRNAVEGMRVERIGQERDEHE